MARKLTMLGLALAAVGMLATPVAASASPELRDHSGKVQVGAALILTSTNTTTTNTALGDLSCEHVQFTAVVATNSGGRAAAQGTSGQTSTCFAGGVPLTVTKPTLVSMETTGGDEGTLSMTFIDDVGPFECHFAGTGSFTYGTGTGEDVIHIPGIELGSEEICEPEEGTPVLHGDFTMTTESTGAEVWFE